jgi:hypothetical protein
MKHKRSHLILNPPGRFAKPTRDGPSAQVVALKM